MPAQRMCDVLVLRVLLEHGPLTAAQIAAKGDMKRAAVNEGLRHLGAAKRIYVSGFDDTSVQGRERPIYAVGNEPDAVFVPKSGAEHSARYAVRHSEEIRMRDRKRRNGWHKPLERPAP
jgi:predicted ArsR family transcriptional regulator